MNMKHYAPPHIHLLLVLVFVASTLGGCIAAVPLIIEGAAALSDHQAGQFKDIEMTLGRGFTRENVRDIKTISFSAKSESAGNAYGFTWYSGNTLLDNLTKEFLKEGYDVFEGDVMQGIMEENNLKPTVVGLAKAGKIAGIQAIATVRVETGTGFRRGVFGIGTDIKSGVLSASIRWIDIDTSRTVLIITASYKKPKSSTDVARNIAGAFKAYQKIETTDGGEGS